MTLKEQIMKLQTYKMYEGEDTVYVERDDVLKTLEQEPCDDAISRQALLEKAIIVPIAKVVTEDKVICRKVVFVEDIQKLPSVTPKFTDAEIQKMQELEQAQLEKAYEFGKAEVQPCEDAVSKHAVLETIDSRIEQIKRDADAINKSYSHLSYAEGVYNGYCRLKCDLWGLPSVTLLAEPCEDCISRQALLDKLERPMNWTDSEAELQEQRDYEGFIELVKSMPAVTPKVERKLKIGYWTYCPDDNGKIEEYPACWCSRCFEYAPSLPNDKIARYCPNCGCRMVDD